MHHWTFPLGLDFVCGANTAVRLIAEGFERPSGRRPIVKPAVEECRP
ncbi:hypothetical protein [Kitasatospora sp. NPDC093558]